MAANATICSTGIVETPPWAAGHCSMPSAMSGKISSELAKTVTLRSRVFVSTVGRDEEVIRNYIGNQKEEDQRLDQMTFWRCALSGDAIPICRIPPYDAQD